MRSLLIKRLMLVIAVGLIFTSAFLWFATPQKSTGFASAAVAAPGAGQKKVVLKNLRMAWIFCKAAVAAKLKQVPGVIAYDVDLKTDSATVLYDPTKVTVDALIQAIIQAGFQVKGIEELPK